MEPSTSCRDSKRLIELHDLETEDKIHGRKVITSSCIIPLKHHKEKDVVSDVTPLGIGVLSWPRFLSTEESFVPQHSEPFWDVATSPEPM